jgi:hypothetical protein
MNLGEDFLMSEFKQRDHQKRNQDQRYPGAPSDFEQPDSPPFLEGDISSISKPLNIIRKFSIPNK